MVYAIVFLLGIIIGSFLNVVILRLNTGKSIVKTGSQCFNCGKALKWFELVPIVSFVFQKGRCRQCKSKISWQYPIVELITGIVFTLVLLRISNFQFPISKLLSTFYFLIFGILIAISAYDIRHKIIPNQLVYFFITLSLFSIFFDFGHNVFGRLLAGPLLFSFFALLWFISRGKWMGFGDAKLALGIGWLLGFKKGILALFISFWIGAIFGLLLMLFSKKIGLKSKIPFGPFLALAAFISFFAGEFLFRDFFFSL